MKKVKKKMITVLAVVVPFVALVLILISAYLFVFNNTDKVKAQEEKNVSQKMLEELQKEQKFLEQERTRLEEYERNLKVFEAELEQKSNDFLLKEKAFNEREVAFNKKLEEKTVDRQIIETYENIDPEQAAVLLKNLYAKDAPLAVLLMRKIAGKKAGKILEAMIPIDREVSTQLAKETLDYYKSE